MTNRKSGNKGLRNFKSVVTFFLLLFFLVGCVTLSDPETSQDFSKTSAATVNPDQTAGQTFISRRSKLNGIELWLRTDDPGKLLKFELFHNIGDQNPLYEGFFRTSNGKTRIEIPAQDTPPDQSYYVRVSGTQGEVELLGRDEDIYPKGNAIINDLPINADIAFRATYEYDANSVLADFRWLLSGFNLLLPLAIVLFLPGWILLDITNLKDQFDWGERVAISLGISLAIIPISMLWTSLLGLHWGPISVWMASSGLIITILWRWYTSYKGKYHNKIRKIENPIILSAESQTSTTTAGGDHKATDNTSQSLFIFRHAGTILLIGIFTITIFTRFAMVRDLVAPPWVDSIHHGLITRLMMENGGIPETYAPYLPPEADYYHYGFHSALSFFIWLTGYEIHDGMLIFGQVLNALIMFAIYLLTKTLTMNRNAALTAALIAGVFTLMPAYYTSWGRYTQLVGLLVLPVGFRLFVNISRQDNFSSIKSKMLVTLGGITFAGLFLIHYRVTAFLGLLIIAFILSRFKPRSWIKNIKWVMVIGMLSVMLLLPWLPGAIKDLLIPKGIAWSGGASSFSTIPWNFLKPGLGKTALVLAGAGLVFGLTLKKRFPITIILWTGMLYLLANLSWLKIPGTGFVNPVSMEITLFIPIAVLGGFAIGGILEILDKYLPDCWQLAPRVVFVVIGAITSILGAQRLLPILNTNTFLAREEDFPAIDWIEKNISESETILINPAGWGYGLYMGHDGGYWISPLTGRQTLPPPVLYGLGDTAGIRHLNQVIEELLLLGEDADGLWEWMQAEEIRFVYIGRRGGIISPKALETSGLFLIRYHQDSTWVFETLIAPQQ